MPDFAVGENIALEVFHELMNPDLCLVTSEMDHFPRLYMGIERRPLAGPIGSYFFPAYCCTTL